uniref:AsIV-cont00163-ORF1 n=1 Tax=Apophua simplicipes ichnovirus TaxID=1329648 RepID=S5DMS0_9VIRU|nr:AsIV-cont00163-ORF1 [Apophua simplicipes ichnovirus]
MHCVVDVQGFKQSGDRFVLKEFAMVTIDVETVKHLEFVVKPPYPFEYLLKEHRAANLWLTRNVHGISWDSGTISYFDQVEIKNMHIFIIGMFESINEIPMACKFMFIHMID